MQISIDLEDGTISEEEARSLMREINDMHPEMEARIESPKGVFPVEDPVQLILVLNAAVQISIIMLPKIRDTFARFGKEVEIVNMDEIAAELLEDHIGVNQQDVQLTEREVQGSFVVFVFEDESTKHHISVNEDSPRDWRYERESR